MRRSFIAFGMLCFVGVAACGSPSGEEVVQDELAGTPAEEPGNFGVCTPTATATTTLHLAANEAACTAPGYFGRAAVLKANLNLVVAKANVSLSDTGDLPSAGGYRDAELLTIDVAGVVRSGTARAKTGGAAGKLVSYSGVEGLRIGLLGVNIAADVIESEVSGVCGTTRGGSRLVGLKIAGATVLVTGAPNQTIEIAGVRIVINERSTVDGVGLRLAALHVSALGLADIVVAAASGAVSCECGPGGIAGGGPGDPGGGSGGDGDGGGSGGGGSGGGGGDPEGSGGGGGGDDPGGSGGSEGGGSGGGSSGDGTPGGNPSGGPSEPTVPGEPCDDDSCGAGYTCAPAPRTK